MDEVKDMQIIIEGDASIRKGVYSNLSAAKTSAKETILDFAFVDALDESGTQLGVLQARVIMSNDAFAEFAEMIDDHFGKNFKRAESDE